MDFAELERLVATKGPHEIFAKDIDTLLIKYQALCHPDRFPGDDAKQERATRLFNRITELAGLAKKPAAIIKSPKRQYTLSNLLAVGDIADIYRAIGDDNEYIVKISRIRNTENLLQTEYDNLAKLLTAAGDTSYRHYIPTIAETFVATDRFSKRINVFTFEPGFYTFQQVLDKHRVGLDGRHLAWIFKRLLTVLGFAHRSNIVHGAVIPPHILIHAENHGLRLVDWIHSVPVGTKINTISGKFQAWYPPEILSKDKCSPSSDIYMAAKCMIYIAGGNPLINTMPESVPEPIERFLRTCLYDSPKMRPSDAWDTLDEFTEILSRLYGRSRFHHLSMV